MGKKMIFHKLSQKQHTHIILATLLVLVGIFLYLRFQPIQLQTVPYTYDQGRDFLAARDIVVNKDITLIGPTTGAGGVFHGAGWYYFLAIPFAFTGGNLSAFYYFIALSALVQGGLFAYFLGKKTHPFIGLLFLSIVAIAPYFIRTSIFAISSIMTLPFILLLMYALYSYLETKKIFYLGLFTFSVGMILEGEVAFGVFLIPAVFLAMLLTRQMKGFIGSVQKIGYALGGFVLAVSLRIIFELKNSFLQTKSLWQFKDTPGTHDVTFKSTLPDRIHLFSGYFKDIFIDSMEPFGWLLLILALLGVYLGYKKYNDTEKTFIRFTGILILGLFFMSLLYSKNFFWEYYYEGIQYFFVGLLMFGLYGLIKYKKKLGRRLVAAFLIVFLFSGVNIVYQKYQSQEEPQLVGLLMHTTVVDYLADQVGNENFCLRMYTPPARTYTYDYLLDLKTRTDNFTYPRTVYTDNECWYIVESDRNSQRIQEWLETNIPSEAVMTHEHPVSDSVVIQRWEVSGEPEE